MYHKLLWYIIVNQALMSLKIKIFMYLIISAIVYVIKKLQYVWTEEDKFIL